MLATFTWPTWNCCLRCHSGHFVHETTNLYMYIHCMLNLSQEQSASLGTNPKGTRDLANWNDHQSQLWQNRKEKTKSMDFIHKTDRSRAMKRHIKVSTHTTHTCIYIYIYIYACSEPKVHTVLQFRWLGSLYCSLKNLILCYVLFISVVFCPA